MRRFALSGPSVEEELSDEWKRDCGKGKFELKGEYISDIFGSIVVTIKKGEGWKQLDGVTGILTDYGLRDKVHHFRSWRSMAKG